MVDISFQDYRDSHKGPSKVKEYDPQFWISGTTNHLFWEIERILLKEIIDKMDPYPKRALDFACGTGRVLSFLEKHIEETHGVDISSDMLRLARSRCKSSSLIEGDLTTNPALLDKRFDLVTAFRFFLNAQPTLRKSALEAIALRLKKDGLLVANFHLNPLSLTGGYLRFRYLLKGTKRRAMLTLNEAKAILEDSGFEPVEVRGYGYLFHRRKYVRFIRLRAPLEKVLSRTNPLPSLAMNFLIAAKPK